MRKHVARNICCGHMFPSFPHRKHCFQQQIKIIMIFKQGKSLQSQDWYQRGAPASRQKHMLLLETVFSVWQTGKHWGYMCPQHVSGKMFPRLPELNYCLTGFNLNDPKLPSKQEEHLYSLNFEVYGVRNYYSRA